MVDRTGVDAITITPYMGRIKGLQPFLDRADKGAIVLCRTSNAGGAETQDIPCVPLFDPDTEQFYASERHYELENGHPPTVLMNDAMRMPYYKYIAYRVTSAWNANGNCVMVVGATVPEEMVEIRKIAGNMPLLIPGIGKQGGDLKSAVLSGIDSEGQGIIVNNSSALTFASDGPDYADAAAKVAEGMHKEITEIIAQHLAAA